MLLLQTVEKLDATRNSGEPRLRHSLLSGRSCSVTASAMAGGTGSVLGFICAMVGGALGSAWGHELIAAVAATVLSVLVGCFYARREHRSGDRDLADFLLSTAQAGTIAGLGSALGLGFDSLVVMQLAFVAGVVGPALLARMPAPAQAYSM